ncbi:HAD-superfamily hydrolase subfamily IA variant 3 [Penicillium hordei]|uniref:HAD-superfamily hydrolase subfamily IA variant 3 n=1 Tax=Penicillium hordei TaxID=40994 RepID=A0AAD6H6R4_9EURO|nr:HAD-superfamily hydrolase subfamily IA variant 3 [Penicillium hordei]KAJ5607377.1 HAD-superfamily hydrolase subfamily IA variant 3 [Penicillium hordei]
MSEDHPPALTFDALVLDLRRMLIKTPQVYSNKSIPSLKRFTSTLAKIEETRCYDLLGKQFGFNPSELNGAIALARTTVEYDEQVVSCIQALRKDQPSLIIVAMSNISNPDFDAIHTRWGPAFWPLFGEVFPSSAVGMRKPTLGFYRHVLKVHWDRSPEDHLCG